MSLVPLLIQLYVLGAQKNRLIETVLLNNTKQIFCLEIKEHFQLRILIWRLRIEHYC